MKDQAHPPLTERQEATRSFIRQFGRINTAYPTLRQIAIALQGGTLPQTASEHVEALVRKSYLEKRPGEGHRAFRLIDEREIPVVLATTKINPGDPLHSESRIIETMRGVLSEAFDPQPDFFAVVKNGRGCTDLLAISRSAETKNGRVVVGRFRDEIVMGKIEGQHVNLDALGTDSEGKIHRIHRTDPDFRLEGIVVGTIKATPTPITD